MKKLLLLAFVSSLSLLSAYVMSSTQTEHVTHLSQEEFSEFSKQPNTIVIDVRTPGEFSAGYIPDAINIPHRDIISGKITLGQYKDKNIVFYCHSGVRAKIVTDYLKLNPSINEQQIFHLKGDFRAWQAKGKTIIRP